MRELEPPVVEVHVTDNGPGMTAHERSRAFDRFWRAHPRRQGDFGGNGLGLPIVAKLVVADGGEVHLDEAPGGGLDAVITLRPVELLPPPEGERRRRALYR
jgi:signal transduction histidine kinase